MRRGYSLLEEYRRDRARVKAAIARHFGAALPTIRFTPSAIWNQRWDSFKHALYNRTLLRWRKPGLIETTQPGAIYQSFELLNPPDLGVPYEDLVRTIRLVYPHTFPQGMVVQILQEEGTPERAAYRLRKIAEGPGL